MENDNCIFCDISLGRLPSEKLYEDASVMAFLDINPIADGHILVVPRRHISFFHELDSDLSCAVTALISRVAKALLSELNCEGYNVLCNNGIAAGQLVSHLHFHVIPRYSTDELFDKWQTYEYPNQRRLEIFDKMSKRLS